MIKIKDNQTIATFGTGDIGINSLTSFDGQHKLGFYNQTEREIGAEADIKKGDEVDDDLFEILFEFTKVESIDVIIKSLEQVKTDLKGNR